MTLDFHLRGNDRDGVVEMTDMVSSTSAIDSVILAKAGIHLKVQESYESGGNLAERLAHQH